MSAAPVVAEASTSNSYSPSDCTSQYRRHLEAWAMGALAGREGTRLLGRMLNESAELVPYAWWRTWEDGDAPWHEASHAVCHHATGLTVWTATLAVPSNVTVNGWPVIGYVTATNAPEPPPAVTAGALLDPDRRHIAQTCLTLTLAEGPYGWRSALRIRRHLAARTRAILAENWEYVVAVAKALTEERTLDHHRVRELLREMKRDTA